MIPAGEVIIENKTIGNEFYIMLSGKCGVYYQREAGDSSFVLDEGRMSKLKTLRIPAKKRIKSSYPGIPKSMSAVSSRVILKEEIGFAIYFLGRLMRKVDVVVGEGSFGEMALDEKNPNGIRMATILAEDDCHCLVLNRDSFLVTNLNKI